MQFLLTMRDTKRNRKTDPAPLLWKKSGAGELGQQVLSEFVSLETYVTLGNMVCLTESSIYDIIKYRRSNVDLVSIRFFPNERVTNEEFPTHDRFGNSAHSGAGQNAGNRHVIQRTRFPAQFRHLPAAERRHNDQRQSGHDAGHPGLSNGGLQPAVDPGQEWRVVPESRPRMG